MVMTLAEQDELDTDETGQGQPSRRTQTTLSRLDVSLLYGSLKQHYYDSLLTLTMDEVLLADADCYPLLRLRGAGVQDPWEPAPSPVSSNRRASKDTGPTTYTT